MMDYQPYNNNDNSIMSFQRYNYHQFDQQDMLSSPPNEIYNASLPPVQAQASALPPPHWSHMNDMDCEDLSQPERGIAGFVSKLYQCLQAPDDGNKYARWCRHNGIDMFIIDCIPKFTEIVLPQLFKHCKFASFVRQLNIYGFQRDTDARKSKDSKDKETCRWHHNHFRPGRRDLFHLIRRKTPRYSRRKRQRAEEEEDPETILNVGSGDESDAHHEDDDSANNSFDERRRSASSASSTSLTLQHQNINNSNNNMTTSASFDSNQHSRHLHMVFEDNSQHVGMSLFSTTNPQESPLSAMEDSYCQFVPALSHLPHHTTEVKHPDSNTNMHQTMAQNEEQLRSQIIQLQVEYQKMYKVLTGEINKAFSTIDVQKSRIEFLENSLRQEMRMKPHFIDTSCGNSAYFPGMASNSNMLVHTAPTTPVYPQSMKPVSFDDMSCSPSPCKAPHQPPQQHLDYLFSQQAHHDDDSTKLLTPSSSSNNDKWLSPFHQNNQSSVAATNLGVNMILSATD